ncbi:MAG: hypothetical protein AAFY88_31175 [Acidobacteriota bacterium]
MANYLDGERHLAAVIRRGDKPVAYSLFQVIIEQGGAEAPTTVGGGDADAQ